MTNTPNTPAVPAPEGQLIEPQRPTNSLAIIAFVLSMVGFISGIGFIAGIVCGHISLSQIKRTHESGRGLAVAALVIGYIMVVFMLILIALVIILISIAIANGQLTTGHHMHSYNG